MNTTSTRSKTTPQTPASLCHLGIDVAKAKLDCALRLPNGSLRRKVVSNTPGGFTALGVWLGKQGATRLHACLEATGIYWEEAALWLAAEGFVVSVINPAQIKAYAASRLSRTKTDSVDAALIAGFCAERQPAPWQPPSLSEQNLRAMVLRLDGLIVMRGQESNRLEVARDAVKADIAAHLAWLDARIKALEKAIRQHMDGDNQLRQQRELLDTVPSLGERTIPILLAYFAQPERFDSARQVAAFAGLNIRQRQSGTSVRGQPRLSKVGHAFLRKALYFPAVVALHKTAWGKLFHDRLKRNGKSSMCIIGAMMRKLLHVAFGVLKSGLPFNPAKHGLAV